GQRENADAVDVGAHFLVPELHVRRRLQDVVRAVARSADVRRRPIDGNGQDHDARVVEGRAGWQDAAEDQRLGVIVLKRKLHGQRASKRASGKGRPLTDMTGPERSKRIGFRAARVAAADVDSALTSSGRAIVASACTVTCSASVASLPQLRASSRLEPDAPPKCGTSVTIWSA